MNSFAICIIFAIIYHAVTVYNVLKIKLGVKNLCIGAVTCALTLILAAIMFPLPTGAIITCGSLLPIMILAVVYDYRLAIACGWICGILALILLPVWQPVHWAQVAIEHLICFSCLGYAGKFGSESKPRLILGALIAVLIQLCAHTMSGVIFYSQNVWDGWGPWAYSIVYNFTSRIPEQAASVLILTALPLNRIKNAIKRQDI